MVDANTHNQSDRACECFRLQLKSTLVDRIIRDLGLIPPDHAVIRKTLNHAKKFILDLRLLKKLLDSDKKGCFKVHSLSK